LFILFVLKGTSFSSSHFPFFKGSASGLPSTTPTPASKPRFSPMVRYAKGLAASSTFAPDFHDRRMAQKAILDGRAGATYAKLQSFYEFLIETKRQLSPVVSIDTLE
jgi:hypothetical protein